LFIAAKASTNHTASINFDRYVAINPPVRLLQSVSNLDEFFQAPLEWPDSERTARIQNTFLKVASLTKNSLSPNSSLPFSAVESKFLVGLAFRFILRDVIFSTQQRHNQGVLERPLRTLRREAVFQEILSYSYGDYLRRFVVPYYQSRGVDLTVPGALDRAGDLRTYTAGLRANQNIRIIENRNDILLADEDLEWFHATFAPEQLTVFEQGGHLGNLAHPAVQKAILDALEGLAELPSKSSK
jgi:hypothetical protein